MVCWGRRDGEIKTKKKKQKIKSSKANLNKTKYAWEAALTNVF